MESIVRAFASPYEAQSTNVPALVAMRVFERTRKAILARLEDDASTVLSDHVLATVAPLSGTWRPELGIASNALEQDAVLAALQFLIAFYTGSFEISGTLEKPGKLFLEGDIVVVAGTVIILATDDTLTVRSEAGDKRFERRFSIWINPHRSRPVLPPASAEGRGFYFMTSLRTAQSAVFPDPFSTDTLSLVDEAKAHDVIANAISALDVIAAGYGAWIRDALVGASLVPKGTNIAVTSPRYPGLVALQSDIDRLDYVEVLVVAACHQRLCQLALVRNLGMPGREEVHYIPTRRSYLTSRRALAASLEHINVILACESIEAIGEEGRDLERRIERRRLMLATDCVPVLERSDTLSEAGAELWRWLKSCLEEHGKHRVGSAISLPRLAENESVGPQIPVAGVAT